MSEDKNGSALVVNVGSTNKPIINAIKSIKPEFVLFVCSADDRATGNPGTYVKVEGVGKIIKNDENDEKPTLPNIRVQAGYDGDYKCIQTNPDDLDGLFMAISSELEQLTNHYERVVCDYTAGTKSMSSALVLAAIDNHEAELNLISGPRANHQRVHDSHGKARSVTTGNIRFQREFKRALSFWQSHSYSVSVDLLDSIIATDPENQAERDFAMECSRALAAWDVFDHETARETFHFVRGRLKGLSSRYIGPLVVLCQEDLKADACRILDLWRNAERCAVRGRYDDATARAYRLLEWCAQWLLKHYCDVSSTGAIPATLVPEDMTLSPSQSESGSYQASLMQAWDLVALNCGEDAGKYWNEQRETTRGLLVFRNNSLLAHGTKPVIKSEWQSMESYVSTILLPHMMMHFKKVKVGKLPDQLPMQWIEC